MNRITKSLSPGLIILYSLAAIALILTIIRFFVGLGPISNLSDGYPWGIWIGIDIMAGIALTAGGMTIAALVHIFGGEKYRPVLRPALLTAFLGYVLEIVALMVDLGRAIQIWHALIYWNNDSPMFLVCWCVILYATILAIELAPVIFEEFKMTRLQEIYPRISPWVSIIVVSFFVFLMSTILWGVIALVVFSILWLVFRFALPKGTALVVLIITGVVLSVAHQSSLGMVFLIIPQKLSTLWYSPLLPIDFLITAVAVGCAMVIVESQLSSKVFGFGLETHVIVGLAKALIWILALAIIFKLVTLIVYTGFAFVATGRQVFYYLVEVIVGLILPFILLLIPRIRHSARAIFYPATMVVFGVIMNRANVGWIGININNYQHYYPNILEILITLGIFSFGILLFYHVCKRFPVFEKGEA